MNPDPMKTTEDDRRAIEKFNQNKQMIQSLEDLASMSNEIIQIFDSVKKEGGKSTKEMGALLVDMRDKLTALNDKEAPESPDYAKPVVEAVSKLEKALSASIKAIDVKPQVKVDAPPVNISPSFDVDLKGVEKVLKGDLPKAFKQAIDSIPKAEKTDFTPVIDKLEALGKQLQDIDTGVRMKPGGVNAKITNTASNPVPITGTITATVDTTGLATSTKQSDGSQKTQIVDAGGEVATVTGGKLDVNATASLAGEAIPITGATTAVGVGIVDGSGNQITSFGGGTQYSDADVNADPTGTVAMGTDGSNVFAVHTDTSGDLQVDVLSSALPSGAATSAKQDTLIGHVDGIEGLLTTIDGDTGTLAATDFATEAKQDDIITAIGAIPGGGGTQYTEGDTDATFTGTVSLVEGAANAAVTLKQPTQPTDTQPVSAASLPLPTGASTSAKQDTGNTSLSSIDGKITAVNTGAVVVSNSALPSGAATAAKQPALGTAGTASADVITVQGKAAMTPLLTDGSATTQPVSASSLPLPTGASTSAKQDDIITAIGAIPGGGGTQYTEDAASAANPVGTALNLVREDARAGGLTTTDGDNVAARGNNKGELYVKTTDSDALLATIDADTGNISTKIDTVAGAVSGTEMQVDVLTSALPTGASTSAKQDTIIGHLDGVEGLLTDIEADTDTLAVVGSGTEATAQRVTIATDSTGVLSVDDNGSSLTVDNAGLTELASAINSDKVDVNIASSGIALGGTSAADDADFTAGTTAGTPSMGVYESTPTSVTDGDLGTVGITAGRRLKTSATIDAALPAGTNNIGDVDVVSMPTTTVQATNLDIRDLTNADIVTAELSATDNAVLDAIAASTAAIDTDTSTVIGHLDGVEGLLTTIAGDTTDIEAAVELLDDTVATLGTTTYTEASTKGLTIGAVRRDANTTLVDTTNEVAPLQVNATGELKVAQIQALPAGTNNIGDVDIASIAAGDNNIGNVDVVTLPSLPAGTNGIGKLTANSGVDIGDVDVTSAVSATLDHGSNRDVDTAAEQITSTSFACKFGVTLKADAANTGILYIGNSDVTAGTTAATDGYPLSPGESLTLEVTNSNIPYAIASANNQVIYWAAV